MTTMPLPAPLWWDAPCTTQTPLPVSPTQTPWPPPTGGKSLCLTGEFIMYKLCRLNFINIYFLKTWCVLHSNIDNILYVSSGLITTASPPFHLCAMWQVRASMGSKYRRAQVLDGHDLGRVIPLADQGTNPAQVAELLPQCWQIKKHVLHYGL